MNPSGPTEHVPQSPNVEELVEQVRAEARRHATACRAVEVTGSGISTPALSADQIMMRVRAEVEGRHGSNEPRKESPSNICPLPTSFRDIPLPRCQSASPYLPEQGQYVVADFLRFHDADFVDIAYQALLRRVADTEGRKGYLDALRSGAISKIEILGMIRFSEEGRRQAVHVDGLLLPYKLHRWRHIRIIGWFLSFGMAVFRLPRLAWRLQGMEAAAAREAHEFRLWRRQIASAVERHFEDADHALDALRSMVGQVSALEGTQQSIYEALRANDQAQRAETELLSVALHASNTERAAQLEAVHEALTSNESNTAALAKSLETRAEGLSVKIEAALSALRERDAAMHKNTADRLSVCEAALSKIDEQGQSDHRSLLTVLDRLAVFLNASALQSRNDIIGQGSGPSPEEQYASFEQTFRGNREQIKARATHYLGTLAAAGIRPGDDALILDLGSGRGEWLEVLAEHGYRGVGVDSNRGMLEISRAYGYEVVEADALEYLSYQPANSLAAITSMHMVEHVPHPVVSRLLDQALRVLRPGGLLILETPNPENVIVGSCMFYMDPTHLHPIPPPLLQWTVQARGFEQVIVERLSEHRGGSTLTPVSDKVPGAEQINQMIAWFTAAEDYAVIGKKPLPI